MNWSELNAWDTASPINSGREAGQPGSYACATTVGVPVNLLAKGTPASTMLESPLLCASIETSPAEAEYNAEMPMGRDTETKPAPSTPSALARLPPSASSPTMRKASPLPLPAYPTPSAPWQYSHGPNGTTPSSDGPTTPTAAGKTSQVLAKLTAENDRLRREIKAERAAREEATEQYLVLKGRVNRLEEQNATLTHQFDTNEGALTRKERRLDDLRTTLDEEAARRKRAEEREAEMGRKLGETVSQAAKEVAEAHTLQKSAETAYSTISKEYSGLQKRIDILRKELREAVDRIDSEKARHRRQLTQLELVLDHQRREHERSDKQVAEMKALINSYQQTEDNVKSLEKQMKETVDEMRWAIGLHQARQRKPS